MISEIRRKELQEKRKEAGLSQFDTAYKLGISGAVYQRIEAGYVKPRPDVAERLVEMFNLPKTYFTPNAQ